MYIQQTSLAVTWVAEVVQAFKVDFALESVSCLARPICLALSLYKASWSISILNTRKMKPAASRLRDTSEPTLQKARCKHMLACCLRPLLPAKEPGRLALAGIFWHSLFARLSFLELALISFPRTVSGPAVRCHPFFDSVDSQATIFPCSLLLCLHEAAFLPCELRARPCKLLSILLSLMQTSANAPADLQTN